MTRHSDRDPKGGRTGGRAPADPEKTSRKSAGDVVRVRAMRTDKPRHGQKRRSSQKRHEIAVVRELQLHPEESPSEVARSLRERPPAQVIDVREGLRRREQAQQPSAQTPREEAPKGLFERGRERVIAGIGKVMNTAVRIVTFSGELVQTLREIRHREA